MPLRADHTIAALAVALGGPPALVLLSKAWFGDAPSLGIAVALQVVYCGLAAFVIWIVLTKEKLPLTSIGLRRPRWSTFVMALALWIVSLNLLPWALRPLRDAVAASPNEGLPSLLALPQWFRLILAITGGIVEEVLYRGYAIERLTTLTGRRWLGAMIAAAAFGLAHAPYWGLRYALVADLPFGIVATLFYVWRRDLVANILAHDAGLIVGVLSLPH